MSEHPDYLVRNDRIMEATTHMTQPGKRQKVALYLRVSTHDQTTLNQRAELMAVATRREWDVVAVYEDAGVSGSKARDARPGLAELMAAATQRKFDCVAAWSVDRLGRSLQDLVATLNDLQGAGVGLYLHQQALDTGTPSGRAMFSMCGVFAEFERALIRERVMSGLARARAEGRIGGRPCIGAEAEERILDLYALGVGKCRIARELGLSVGVVQRVTKGRERGHE